MIRKILWTVTTTSNETIETENRGDSDEIKVKTKGHCLLVPTVPSVPDHFGDHWSSLRVEATFEWLAQWLCLWSLPFLIEPELNLQEKTH